MVRVVAADESDEELFASARAGNRASAEKLVRRYRTPLYSYVLRSVPDADRALAEDLTHDAFVRVLRGAEGWRDGSRFAPWLYAVARNICIDAARRRRVRLAESLESSIEQGGAATRLSDRAPGPERSAAIGQLRPALVRALEALPPEQRDVFLLREAAGLPFKEVALLTGASENTVKSRMRYALEALRRRLLETGIDGDLADADAALGGAS